MGGSSSKVQAAKTLNDSVGDMSGRRAIIFGGTSGIGRAIANRLAKSGCDVVVVGRNAEWGAEAVSEMNNSGKGTHLFVRGDALLMAGARDASLRALEAIGGPPIDFLVMCQTMATIQTRTETEEGIDQKLALNLYSRFQCIESLIPALLASPDARILSVLSAGVHAPYADYKTNPDLSKNYSLKNAADIAGFYNDLGLDALATRYPDMTFIHAAPGFVDTHWGSEMPGYIRGPIRALQACAAKSASDCAELLSTSLLDPSKKGGFKLIGEFGQPVSKTNLHTDEAREFVWKHIEDTLNSTKKQ